MSSLKELFTEKNFKSTIEKYCEQIGWSIAGINDDQAILVFDMESGREQVVIIQRYDQILEFTVPTTIGSATEDELPHEISTILMKQNAGLSYGFWAIKKINDEFLFVLMQNLLFELITVENFQTYVEALYGECEKFEMFIRHE